MLPSAIIRRHSRWHDNIVADRKAEFAERMQLQTSSGLRPELNVAWYFGVDEETALEMIEQRASDNFWGDEE